MKTNGILGDLKVNRLHIFGEVPSLHSDLCFFNYLYTTIEC